MSFGGFIRRQLYWKKDLLTGSQIRKLYNELKFSDKDYENGYKLQQKHLSDLLQFANQYSQYYKNISPQNGLESYPVVNKEILKDYYNLVAIPAENIPWQAGPLFIQKTGGSTGVPFSVPQDTRKRYRRVAEIKYYNELCGFKSHERLLHCRVWTNWHNKSKSQIFRENIIPFNVIKMDENRTKELVATIKKKHIRAIRAYASWYNTLVEFIEEGNCSARDLKSVKVCFSTSETLDENTRTKMLELTAINIVAGYANEEAGIMGHRRLGGTNYYLNNTSYIFEILKFDKNEPVNYGELGRVVITDLNNYAFPLIRYDTGDTAVIEEGNKESNYWPYFSHVYGRRIDLVFDCNDRAIHPMAFSRILKNYPGIRQWQFVQTDKSSYKLRLNINKNKFGENQDKIKKDMVTLLGRTSSLTFENVEEIPVMASGKRKSVICEWNK